MLIRGHLQHTCRSKPPRSGETAVAQIASANHPHTTPATSAPASDSVGQQDEISTVWRITAIRLIGQPATVVRLQVYPVSKVQPVVAPLNPYASPKSSLPCTMLLIFNSKFPVLLVTVSTKLATGKRCKPSVASANSEKKVVKDHPVWWRFLLDYQMIRQIKLRYG